MSSSSEIDILEINIPSDEEIEFGSDVDGHNAGGAPPPPPPPPPMEDDVVEGAVAPLPAKIVAPLFLPTFASVKRHLTFRTEERQLTRAEQEAQRSLVAAGYAVDPCKNPGEF